MITNYPFRQEIIQKTANGDGVLSASYADDYIVRGYGFEIQRRIASLAASSVTKIVIDTSAVTSTSNIYILPLTIYATGGPVLIRTYQISSYSAGTAFQPNKLNYLSTNNITSSSVVKWGITSTDTPGNDLREYVLGSTGNPQQTNRSGSSNSSSPIMFNAGIKLCLEVTNNYTSAIDLVCGVVWYELPISSPATATNSYTLSNNSWTAITSAGQNGICFPIDNGLVLIDHSTTGTGGCADAKSMRLRKDDAFQDVVYLRSASSADIFYAKCMSAPSSTLAVQLN